MKRKLITFFLAGFLAGAAHADDIDAKLPATEREFILGEAAKMQAAGLDAKPLYNKVREGIAKGAPHDALRKAVTRERELYVEAARVLAPVHNAGNPTKNEIAQSVVIAVKRGAKTGDIESAVKLHKTDGRALIGVVDLLGDFARSGIFGEKAVHAATESTGRRAGIPPSQGIESRADMNRSLQQRELRQELPALKPVAPPHNNPQGSQGTVDKRH
jgi:hypothetical protein